MQGIFEPLKTSFKCVGNLLKTNSHFQEMFGILPKDTMHEKWLKIVDIKDYTRNTFVLTSFDLLGTRFDVGLSVAGLVSA